MYSDTDILWQDINLQCTLATLHPGVWVHVLSRKTFFECLSTNDMIAEPSGERHSIIIIILGNDFQSK